MTDQDHIKSFFSHLQNERRLSNYSIAAYKRDLEKLMRFLQSRDLDNFLKLKPAQARMFPAELHRSGLSSASIQRTLSGARTFYRYLEREKLIRYNPFSGVVAPRGRRPWAQGAACAWQ